MLKYAKIVDEETKLCEVGLGDPDAPFSEKVVPAVTHEDVIPAEYDEEGNLIKEEQIVTIVDVEEYTEIITVGDYYESIGMTEMDVEQAYNGNWYVEGYAPEKPAPTWEEIDKAREQYREEHIDTRTKARVRKQANGTWTEADEQAYLALDAEVTSYIEQNLPYPDA